MVLQQTPGTEEYGPDDVQRNAKLKSIFKTHKILLLPIFQKHNKKKGAEITTLAQKLKYEREVIRIWFCNKRQALKNTVRLMSQGMSN